MERGIEVSVKQTEVALPRSCAGCCAPPVTRQLVPHVVPLAGSTLSAPYCARCARGIRGGLIPFATVAGAIVLAIVVGVLIGKAPISGTLAVIASMLAAMVLIGGAVLALPLRPRAAVEVRSRSAGRIVVMCANEAWGRELAERSGGTVRAPARFALFPHAVAIAAATVIAPAVAIAFWDADHARVLVDNASSEPVLVWIDGEPIEIVDGSPEVADPSVIWVTRGWHRIGGSAPGASAPERAERVHTGADTLYNPRAIACHWRVVTMYTQYAGDVETPLTDGPLPREELPYVGHVDHWFESSPERVEVPRNQTRVTRTAIIRYDYCTALVRRGCSEGAVNQLLYCIEHVQSDEEAVACEEAAASRCAEEAER